MNCWKMQRTVCGLPLEVLTELGDLSPQFVFVTAAAQSVNDAESLALGQAPLWGLARVVMRERADLRSQLVDLDRACSDAALAALAREICEPTAEEEIAFRGRERWVRRMVPRVLEPPNEADSFRAPRPAEAWNLTIESPGALETLRYEVSARAPLAPNQVEIAIAAASLNFRDLMLAMGMLPSVASETATRMAGIGGDCAGTIVRCSSEVIGFSPGDEVLAISPNALGNSGCTRFELVAPKPKNLSFEQAAGVPIAFATAHYGLYQLARLGKGERVLIHAATGGVGLAAIQVARAVGAEIFATAGSPEKRAFLKSLGVERIMDSRSLAFVDQILEWTDGAGVDVILNSLAGDAIPRGIELLRPCGRFIEIGKRDIYRDSKIGLLAFRKNLTLFAVDLDRLSIERPELLGSVLREVMARFESGSYTPLPTQIFPASEVEGAMRLMAQAKHIGKIVIRNTDADLRVHVPRKLFRGDATYLIAGGLGGFGLATAEWMVREGARSLVFVSRSEPNAAALAKMTALTEAGARVKFLRGDVTRPEEVRDVARHIREKMPPLRGVFHAAMVLDDRPLAQMSWDSLAKVLAPKMSGAWNLHRETLGDELDYFVLYSSIAAILGNPLQGNYSAANAFLDALAHHRRGLGLAALAVNWGVVGDVGYVSHHPDLQHHLDVRGYRDFRAEQALETLALVLKNNVSQVTIARIDWERLAASSLATASAPAFRQLGTVDRSEAVAREKLGAVLPALLETTDATERLRLLEDYVREKVGKALGVAPQRLDAEKPLTQMGLDSLIAVELTIMLKMDLGFELPALKLLQGLTVHGLAQLAGETIFQAQLGTSARPVASVISAPVVPPNEPPLVVPNDLTSRGNANFDYTKLDYRRWTPTQTIARDITRALFRVGAKVSFDGRAHIPRSGAFIVAVNHLCLLDVPLILTIMPRPVILLADDWLRGIAPARWILEDVGRSIFVREGGDPDALAEAVKVLRAGGLIGLSPEGIRSKTGAMNHAQLGMAYLAAQASVPVIPIAAWGHEKMADSWRRLRRPRVHLRSGEAINVPADVSIPALRHETERIMRTLAALLPESYRGVYG